MKLFVMAVGLLGYAFASLSYGQFYAPETEYHDPAQKRFPVELARVLAWRHNAAGQVPPVAQISYEVETSREQGSTAWKIHWLDEGGHPVRDFAVSCEAGAAASGLPFYRTVAAALLGTLPAGKRTAAEVSRGWWAGMDEAGPSRAASLQTLFHVSAKDPARAPELAGLLLGTVVPSLGGRVSLDGTLLARAAAWLALCEAELRPGEKPNDALWAPILFLSGRENAAAQLRPAQPARAASPSERWWNFLLRPHTAAEAFTFAAEEENRARALPLLVYEHMHLDLGAPLVRAVPLLFREKKALAAQHDYGPVLTCGTTIGGGRLTEGAWPFLSRLAFAECLRDFHPEPGDFSAYGPALQKIRGLRAYTESGPEDASVVGLGDAADLLNLGLREGVGPLRPVATVTTRDLLNFGWEMNGTQLSARWRFVAVPWGVPALAESIAKATLSQLDGAEYFVRDYAYRKPATAKFITRSKLEDPKRLQEMSFVPGEWMGSARAFSQDKAENIRLWMRRCWLHATNTLYVAREYYFAKMRDEVAGELRRLHAEGGPSCDAELLSFFVPGVGLNGEGLKQCPGTDELRREMIAAPQEPSETLINASWDKHDSLPPLEKAQALEKLFWQRPGDELPYAEIFSGYVQAHAWRSAKRFYRQAREAIEDPVVFGNTMGTRRYMLALLEHDAPAMAEALTAGASGSFGDLSLNIIDSARQGNMAAVREQAEECLRRYGQNALMTKVKDFVPLFPALRQAQSPEHNRALDFFAGDDTNWPALLWVLAEQAKLPPAEAARFFGGREASPERRLLVAYELEDRELFRSTCDAFAKSVRSRDAVWSNSAFSLIHYLEGKLFGISEPAEQPDLRPSGAKSLTRLFAEKMGAH